MMGATLCALVAVSACKPESDSDGSQTVPPNFITIVLDDMGYSDLQPYGSEIQTPNIQALADEGVMFTNFYAHATSTPARGMLFTGKENHKSGVGNMEGWIPFRREQFRKVGYEGILSSGALAIPEVLADNGYYNMFTGKWDLGHKTKHSPSRRGFHETRAVMLMGGDTHWSREDGTIITSHQPSKYEKKKRMSWYNENGKEMLAFPKQFYSSDYYTEVAIEMLNNRDTTKPFYLNITHIAPHSPLQAPEEDIQKYLDAETYNSGWDVVRLNRFKKLKTLGIINPSESFDATSDLANYTVSGNDATGDSNDSMWGQVNAGPWSDLTDAQQKIQIKYMAIYAAMIDRVDQNVKKLVDHLKVIGEYENTVIFIVSDNGGAYKLPAGNNPERGAHIRANFVHEYDSLGGPNSFIGLGPGWGTVANAPFNNFKGDFYDGGIRVPAIIHYPKMNSTYKGKQIDRLSSIMDIGATMLDMANITYPREHNGEINKPLDGKSMASILTKGTVDDTHTYLGWELDGGVGIRTTQYKLSTHFQETPDSLGFTTAAQAGMDPAQFLPAFMSCWSNQAVYDVSSDFFEKTDISSNTNIYSTMKAHLDDYKEDSQVVEVTQCRPATP